MKKKKAMLLAWALGFCLPALAQNLVPMHNDKGRFGYGREGSKEFAISPQWDEARPFNEYGVAIVRKGEKFGIIDTEGNPIGQPMGYSLITPYEDTGLWLVALGGKRSDKEDAGRKNINVAGFKGSTSQNVKGAKWGLLKPDGRVVADPRYEEISGRLTDRLFLYKEKGLYGYMDVNGTMRTLAKYDDVTPFNNQGLAAVHSAGKHQAKGSHGWSLIDKDLNAVIPEEADCRIGFLGFLNNEHGKINSTTVAALLADKEKLSDPQWLQPLLKEGITWVNSDHPYIATGQRSKVLKKGDSLVLYDTAGNLLVPADVAMTSLVYVPSEGVWWGYRKTEESWGFYDFEAKTFTPVDGTRQYLPMRQGRSLSSLVEAVKIGENKIETRFSDYYLVDKAGNKVSESYDGAEWVEGAYITRRDSIDHITKLNNPTYGLMDSQGRDLMPPTCQEVVYAGNGLFGVKDQMGKVGYMDAQGQTVIPFDYEDGSQFVNIYAVVGKTPTGQAGMKKGFIERENRVGQAGMKTGIIDCENRVVLPIAYDRVCAYVDDGGQLHAWVNNGADCYYEADLTTAGNDNATEPDGDGDDPEAGDETPDGGSDPGPRLTPTPYTGMTLSDVGIVVKDNQGHYGLLKEAGEVIPCSLGSEEMVREIYAAMTERGLSTVTPGVARRLAAQVHEGRNAFNIEDTIDEYVWDF